MNKVFLFLWMIVSVGSTMAAAGSAPVSIGDTLMDFSASVGSNTFYTLVVFRSDGTYQEINNHFVNSGQPDHTLLLRNGPYIYQRIGSDSATLQLSLFSNGEPISLDFETDTSGRWSKLSPTAFQLYKRTGEQGVTNSSNRAWISPGRPAISGFIVAGETPRWILLRVAGPTLATFSVPVVIQKPQLTLYNGPYEQYRSAAWGIDSNLVQGLKTVFALAGAFPFPDGSSDVAIFVRLSPGAYTLHGSSATETGEALTEAYVLPYD